MDDPTAEYPRSPATVEDDDLLDAARVALERSYAPYSDYQVGAALLTADGHLYLGCNIEVANYSNSLHAEEVTVGRAVADGHTDFARLGVVSAAGDGVLPCGMCRQTLAEFCGGEFPVVCEAPSEGEESPVVYRLGNLLPDAISAGDLGVED
jgi:cytidine deaminase (EC 3.5.4.5)